jgi:hypothetical protein
VKSEELWYAFLPESFNLGEKMQQSIDSKMEGRFSLFTLHFSYFPSKEL